MKNFFVGVPVEGKSGYINLMRIKARYFEEVMEPRRRKTIAAGLPPFPNFREELFDKLYNFFQRHFTGSGSPGFFFTPYHQSVYEQVHTNEQGVVLFWKADGCVVHPGPRAIRLWNPSVTALYGRPDALPSISKHREKRVVVIKP